MERLQRSLSLKTEALNLARRWLMGPSAEFFLYRLVRGTPVTSVAARLVPNHYQYPQPSWRQTVRHGVSYQLDLSDLMDWHVYFDFLEAGHHRLLQMIRPGDTVIDVGSNIGMILLPMARRTGSTGQVLGFEPSPPLYSKCLANLQLNGFRHVNLLNCALGASNGTAHLTNPDERNSGKTRITAGRSSSTEIQVTTLDRVVAEAELKNVHLIKIDVEGFESHVLRGAEQTIKKYRPQIFIEVSDGNLREQSSSALELIRQLRDLGYDLYSAEDFQPWPENRPTTGLHADLIGIPGEARAATP